MAEGCFITYFVFSNVFIYLLLNVNVAMPLTYCLLP